MVNLILPASVLPSSGSLVLFIFQPEKSFPLNNKVNSESALDCENDVVAVKNITKAVVVKSDRIMKVP